MCRQPVNYMLRLYSREEQQQNQDQYGEVFTQIGNYNRRFGGQPRPVSNVKTKLIKFIFFKAFRLHI